MKWEGSGLATGREGRKQGRGRKSERTSFGGHDERKQRRQHRVDVSRAREEHFGRVGGEVEDESTLLERGEPGAEEGRGEEGRKAVVRGREGRLRLRGELVERGRRSDDNLAEIELRSEPEVEVSAESEAEVEVEAEVDRGVSGGRGTEGELERRERRRGRESEERVLRAAAAAGNAGGRSSGGGEGDGLLQLVLSARRRGRPGSARSREEGRRGGSGISPAADTRLCEMDRARSHFFFLSSTPRTERETLDLEDGEGEVATVSETGASSSSFLSSGRPAGQTQSLPAPTHLLHDGCLRRRGPTQERVSPILSRSRKREGKRRGDSRLVALDALAPAAQAARLGADVLGLAGRASASGGGHRLSSGRGGSGGVGARR